MSSFRLFSLTFVAFLGVGLNTVSVQAQFDDSHIRAVDQNAPGGPGDPGATWQNAYIYLRDALAYAAAHPEIDEIWVAQGTYYPDESDVGDSDNRADTFDLVDGVKLYGGFDGTETILTDRDPETNITILSGDIDQDGVPHDSTDNSWHVVTADGVGATTLINGFTISDAYANGGGTDDNGGGIQILDSSLFIVRCTLANNDAFGGGGINVDVTGTAAPTVFNCSFIKNNSLEGSGMRLDGGPELIRVVNCLFYKSFSVGGAIWALGPDVDVINCTVFHMDHIGCTTGIFHLANGSQVTITNSIIELPRHGPHFFVEEGDGLVIVSFSNVVGGLCVNEGCEQDPCDFVINGDGNIDADPMFCDWGPANNYRLQDGSPCIDTGSDAAVPDDLGDVNDDGDIDQTLPWDLDKRIRQFDGNAGGTLVDMGAYEYQHNRACTSDLDDDCSVGASDLLLLLANWGACPGCPAELDCDLVVGASDLIILLAAWGQCLCGTGPEPPSLQDELDDACLSNADWQDFLDKMANGTPAEQENYICWLTHYFEDCNRCICIGASGCPGPDPFS